jgi:hypothetical protein
MGRLSATRDLSPAAGVRFSDDTLYLRLEDGREIGAPLSWFPRLVGVTPGQRARWRRIGRGFGVHWPDVDEDIAVAHPLGVSD